MISNLLIMVIVGGYETFVSRMNLENHPDQPEWLSHVNASVLKVKLATAIIGISSIHLLKTFINAEAYSEKVLLAQAGIHIAFLLSAMAIAACDRIMIGGAKGGEAHIAFDAVLVAVGRAANLTGYGLEELGIPTGRTVETNEFLQTRFPNIYAAGDVAGPFQFTHTAAHQAWYAAVNALFDPFKRFKADYAVVPAATFIDPEVARVGLNEQEARAQNIAFETSTYQLDDLDRAIADGEAHGFVKVLTVPGKDRILGVTLVGEHAAEFIAEYVLAMKHGFGLNKILGTIHIYPTLAEANKYVAGVWKKAHAPQGLLRWVERFHAWRRGGG